MLNKSDILLCNPKFPKLANGVVKNMSKLANNYLKNFPKLANASVGDFGYRWNA
ncbi:hypothetical protein HMPREF1584_00433 [Gardnerella vaginalis JCP8481A]|nr:hypothetical protein HMPREF1584_00433 [Gardnerella vaginalis JCP8481A]EPI43816.1 hypothetical protein HMPREF1585_00340 [Gardnerella vaginalis JCP8481B]